MQKNIEYNVTKTPALQQEISPEVGVEILKEGNQRFVNKLSYSRNYKEQIEQTSTGQYPFAAVLSCIDSRMPVETIFDQGIGDLFSVRIAGNFINEDILGSLEFACKAAGSKVIVVMGHTSCGAVKGACDHVELGNLTSMLSKIQPAVDAVTDITEDRNSSNKAFVQKVSDINVEFAVSNIKEKSPVLKEMLDNNEISIVAAMYDVATGEVEFR